MRDFTNKITLIKNSRGVYDLDTSKGCYSGLLNNNNGCYDNCYAANYSKRYGYNFQKTVNRNFLDIEHLETIIDKINNIDMPFIRIGVSGDPSENWSNVLRVLKLISGCKKNIVIVTKHWNLLTDKQIKELSKYKVCVNTSISALDDKTLLKTRINQYNRLKDYCKSILRIVSCDFNTSNLNGMWLNDIQDELFKNDNIIDTVLRVNKANNYIKNNIINISKIKFLNNNCYASVYNKKTYLGYCDNCKEMCGINIK